MITQDIIKQVLQLPQAERQIIAESVIQSLPISQEFDEKQLAIINSRLEKLARGDAVLLEGEQAISRLLNKYSK